MAVFDGFAYFSPQGGIFDEQPKIRCRFWSETLYIYIRFARLFRELKKKKVFDNRPESLHAVGKPIEEHKKCG